VPPSVARSLTGVPGEVYSPHREIVCRCSFLLTSQGRRTSPECTGLAPASSQRGCARLSAQSCDACSLSQILRTGLYQHLIFLTTDGSLIPVHICLARPAKDSVTQSRKSKVDTPLHIGTMGLFPFDAGEFAGLLEFGMRVCPNYYLNTVCQIGPSDHDIEFPP
jgi:hypothetical protein